MSPNRDEASASAPALAARLELPSELIEAIAERVVALLARREAAATSSPWLDVDGACAYLSLSRDSLYKLTAARAIPCSYQAG